MNELMQLVANYGFPCVMCILVYVQSNKEISSLRDSIDKMSDILERMYERLDMEK